VAKKKQPPETRVEVQPKEITVCDVCCYGPLSWIRNARGKLVLALVYPSEGKFYARAEHVHLPRACAAKEADQIEKQQSLDQCGEVSPISLRPCIRPAGHDQALFKSRVTDDEIADALHRSACGRSWS